MILKILIVFLCATLTSVYLKQAPTMCYTPSCFTATDYIRSGLDESVNPCDDFYAFTCNNYIKKEMPQDYKAYNELVNIFNDQSNKLTALLNEVTDINSRSSKSKSAELIHRLYDGCVKSHLNILLALDKAKEILEEFGGWIAANEGDLPKVDWTDIAFKLSANGFNAKIFLPLSIRNNIYDKEKHALVLTEPDFLASSHILKQDFDEPDLKEHINIIVVLARVMGATNVSYAEEEAKKIIEVERKLSQIITEDKYDQMSVSELQIKYPAISWKTYLSKMTNIDINDNDAVLSYRGEWLSKISDILSTTPQSVLGAIDCTHIKIQSLGGDMAEMYRNRKGWFSINVQTVFDPTLKIMDIVAKWPGSVHDSTIFNQSALRARFEGGNLNDCYLLGDGGYACRRTLASYVQYRTIAELLSAVGFHVTTSTNDEPDENCRELIKNKLPIAVSALYVRKYITKEVKQQITELVENVKASFLSLIQANEWADDATKDAAIKKIEHMYDLVAYPDELLDDKIVDKYYEPVEYKENFLELLLSISKNTKNAKYSKFRTVPKRDDWESRASVTQVTARYDYLQNGIQILAGIISSPFYNPNFPNYMNYASMGSSVGHEINHGLSGLGLEYDENGLKRYWASDQALAKLNETINCLHSQYVQKHNDEAMARRTSNEDQADAMGIVAGYLAYQSWIQMHSDEGRLPSLGKYTPNQLFWISFGRFWCEIESEVYLNNFFTRNEYSRKMYRVQVPLMNSEEFSKDFKCPSGSKMNPVKKCRIWN